MVNDALYILSFPSANFDHPPCIHEVWCMLLVLFRRCFVHSLEGFDPPLRVSHTVFEAASVFFHLLDAVRP